MVVVVVCVLTDCTGIDSKSQNLFLFLKIFSFFIYRLQLGICAWYSNLFSLLFCFLLLSTTSTISFLCIVLFWIDSLKKTCSRWLTLFKVTKDNNRCFHSIFVYNKSKKTRITQIVFEYLKESAFQMEISFLIYVFFSILDIFSIEYKLTIQHLFFSLYKFYYFV